MTSYNQTPSECEPPKFQERIEKEIVTFSTAGPVSTRPQDLLADKYALELGGRKPSVTTESAFGLVLKTSGENMLISLADVDFHDTLVGRSVGTFCMSGTYIQASGMVILYPGIRLMEVQFETLRMYSDIIDDDINNVDFKFNVSDKPKPTQKPPPKPPPKPTQKRTQKRKQEFEEPTQKRTQKRKQEFEEPPKKSQKSEEESQTSSSGDIVKKYFGKSKKNLVWVMTKNGVRYNKPRGPGPKKKFHPAVMWSFSKGDWYGWFYSDSGRPAYEAKTRAAKEAEAAGGTKKRPREEEPIDSGEDSGEEDDGEEAAEMEKQVGGFPVFKMSTCLMADGNRCKFGKFSFCAVKRDFGIVLDPDAAVGACKYKIVEPTPLGKFLLEQNEMVFFCPKVNASCGLTLSIGVVIMGVVYGVFRNGGSKRPQSLGIGIDFIPKCITPLYLGICEKTVKIKNSALEACIKNWYTMSRLRTDGDESWKLLSDFAKRCEDDEGGITDWQKFQDPEADEDDLEDLEFDATTFYDTPQASTGEKQVFRPYQPFMNWLIAHFSFEPKKEAADDEGVSFGEEGSEEEGSEEEGSEEKGSEEEGSEEEGSEEEGSEEED